MDDQVIAAMARWPNVPAVYGWLSLTARGEWRLHPRGEALNDSGSPGEAITSPPILQFIGRNYAGDEKGRWYFQNGPQRVYVRLDAAPYILHTTSEPADGGGLRTHNGLAVTAVSGWWLDSEGHLYARTEHGPALVAGRDLAAVMAMLQTPDGPDIMDRLAQGPVAADAIPVGADGAPLNFCPAKDIPAVLGFERYPQPDRAAPGRVAPDRVAPDRNGPAKGGPGKDA